MKDKAYFFLDGELMMVCDINYSKDNSLSLLDKFILGCNDLRNAHKFTIGIWGESNNFNMEHVFHTDVENNWCSRLYKSEVGYSEDFASYLAQVEAFNKQAQN